MDGAQPAGPVLAIDHDRLFKELLTAFFLEFLELFFPKLAASLERDSIEFLPQEVFTGIAAGGDQLVADIIAKARFKGAGAFFVIHVEHQSTAPAAFGERFFKYYLAIFNRYGLPVYPIVIYSHDRPAKKQPNLYRLSFPDGEVLRLTYRVVQLNRLPWRRFLHSRNPVSGALMAKMKVARRDRARVKLECLRLMVTLRLDRSRMQLIASFVDSYLNLDVAEERRFELALAVVKLRPKQKEALVEYVTSWERRGIEKGIERGLLQGRQEGRHEALEVLRGVLLEVLATRFGDTGKSVASRIAQIDSLEELRALTHRALTASSLAEAGL